MIPMEAKGNTQPTRSANAAGILLGLPEGSSMASLLHQISSGTTC